MINFDLLISNGWKQVLINEFQNNYFYGLQEFLDSEYANFQVFPPSNSIFEAYNLVPLEMVRVVIIGQDPYHNVNQAHGLCFSVNKGQKIPPSLRNIFKELVADLKIDYPAHGCLVDWAKQGVFLLNATLTVRAHRAGSHQKKGWETFTDATIKAISDHSNHVVFLLWGNFAKKKLDLIDCNKHLVLTSAHPSPLSARNGFFGCSHFSKSNEFLLSKGLKPIKWGLK